MPTVHSAIPGDGILRARQGDLPPNMSPRACTKMDLQVVVQTRSKVLVSPGCCAGTTYCGFGDGDQMSLVSLSIK
jgi:hypothetical protein